ncbi:structure-specific endonuclease subunit slx1 isoform X1 [Hylaeus volcanicus]|uniref:structure-specific endonuclease subunit slx1 isoform X1 n=1 Tax=Hylaeus volcanicus TaxID=313075 RepID=UPI0023B880A6|nr:structure-specific endonuclease subunit slx1 isoform X1 [Hylaeus volcanicus]
MDDAEVIEHFFGVYLLYCKNPKYVGKTYIGYTVNPRRRLVQHNAGNEFGGARKTSKRGPWNMVLIVHGFPNNTSALRFEWAWQNPQRSRRLKHVPRKKHNQKVFLYHLLVLTEMLKVGPWCRLPLTVRWLDYEFYEKYSSYVSAPMHMPICCGKVTSKKIKKKLKEALVNEIETQGISPIFCSICSLFLEEKELVSCIKPNCPLVAHLICLAHVFCKDDMIIPVSGTCPACNTDVLWGDLIRKKVGCYKNLKEVSSSDDGEDT